MLITKRLRNNSGLYLALSAALLGLMLALAGCAPEPVAPVKPQVVTPAQQASSLVALGEERLSFGQYQQAGDAFNAALKLSPENELAARALMGLSRVEKHWGNQARALDLVDQAIKRGLPTAKEPQAQLEAARMEMDLDRQSQAMSRLRRLLARPQGAFDSETRTQALELYIKAAQAAGQQAEVVQAILELSRQGGPAMISRLSKALIQAAGQMPSRRLEPLLAGSAPPELRTALLAALAQAKFNEGLLESAEQDLTELRKSPYAAQFMETIKELDQAISQARVVNPRALGIVLPLSGPYANIGRKVLVAVELGLGLFTKASAHPLTLYIEDSKSDAAEAAAAITRLVQRRRVAAVIGPLGAATSLAAARRAQQLGVPLITLSQVGGITQSGNFVFQNAFNPAEQVRAVLDELMGIQGKTDFAVFAPQKPFGQGFTKLFTRQVQERGGRIVRTIFYNPSLTDYTAEIKKLVHLPPGNYRPGYPDSPKPRIDFQAVFLPTGAEAAAMIAPQLAYFDVLGVDVIGTNLWHKPSLPATAGRYLDRCIFPDAFSRESQDPATSSFINEFKKTTGGNPDVLDAHAYDTAVLLSNIMDRPQPPRTRADLARRISEQREVHGICGLLSVDEQRRVVKPLTLYSIFNGGFIKYNELPPLDRIDPLSPSQGSTPDAMPQSGVGAVLPPQASAPASGIEASSPLPAPAATVPR